MVRRTLPAAVASLPPGEVASPPHLDERIVRDLGFVRSYRFKDGKLFMSRMADGGIYEWRPRRK